MNIKRIIQSRIRNLELRLSKRSKERYINYLRKQGIKIGENIWMTLRIDTISIDVTRPSLVEIGNNVRINRNFTLITHDGGYYVLLNKYHEFIPQSGKVTIGNNVYFGRNCSVFKGVTIGDNCIIGFGSVVTRDIPANSVAVGAPARVVGSVDDYIYERSEKCINEALAYAKSIEKRFHRKPRLEEFWEEFPLFVDKENMHLYPHLPYKRQLGDSFDYWAEHHKKIYDGFEEFLKAAGIE
jgi:acetyltransferase-like isoleucine patch superfamily enzyme